MCDANTQRRHAGLATTNVFFLRRKLFKCRSCDRLFPTTNDLNLHSLSHVGITVVECDAAPVAASNAGTPANSCDDSLFL